MVLMTERTANAIVVLCQRQTLLAIYSVPSRNSIVSTEMLLSVDVMASKQSSMVTSSLVGFLGLVDLGLVFFITGFVLLRS